MENLAHSASFHSGEKTAPSKPGIKHLAASIRHRESHDIDIFFASSKALRLLSPQKNPLTKQITPRWQEPRYYLKLEVVGVGEIDILVTREWVDHPTFAACVGGEDMLLQRPAEILVRKAAYRAPRFKIRDFFDLACVASMSPTEFEVARPHIAPHADDLCDRWKAIEGKAEEALTAEVIPLPDGMSIASHFRERVTAALATLCAPGKFPSPS